MDDIITKALKLQEYSFIKQNAHFSLADTSRMNHTYFGVIVTVISSIVGTAIFSTLTSKEDNHWIQIITGFLSVLAAVLASLQTFLRFSDTAEQHKTAALGYEAVYHCLDTFMLKYYRLSAKVAYAEEPSTEQLKEIKRMEEEALVAYGEITLQVRETSKLAPTIPDKVYNRFKKQADLVKESESAKGLRALAPVESLAVQSFVAKAN